MKRSVAALLVLLGGASYGLLGTFVNFGYGEGYTVGEMTGSQMFFGALFLWVVALFNRRTWKKMRIKTVLLLVSAGSLNGLTGVLYYSSMQTVPASIAIVLLFQFAWVGMLYAWLFDGLKPTKPMLVSLVLILVGTFFAADVFTGGFEGLSPWGVLSGFLSAFTFAGFIYVSGRLATEVTPWLRSPLMVSGAALAIFVLFPPSFFTSGALVEGVWKYTFPLALFGAVVPTVCFTMGAPRLKSGVATILSSIELPVAVVMAYLVLKETVHFWRWFGVLLILFAIAYGELREKKAGSTEPQSK